METQSSTIRCGCKPMKTLLLSTIFNLINIKRTKLIKSFKKSIRKFVRKNLALRSVEGYLKLLFTRIQKKCTKCIQKKWKKLFKESQTQIWSKLTQDLIKNLSSFNSKILDKSKVMQCLVIFRRRMIQKTIWKMTLAH